MDPKPGQIALATLNPPVGIPADLIPDLDNWSTAGKRATSINAFMALWQSGRRKTAAMAVYREVASMGETGMTAREIEESLGESRSTVTARLYELEDERNGLVYRAGDRRRISSGSEAYIYRVTAKQWPQSGSITVRRATRGAKRTATTASVGTSAVVPETAAQFRAELAKIIAPALSSPMRSSPLVKRLIEDVSDLQKWLAELA